ncbi:unnamed protein product, partial [Trichogramma brassicae]
MQHGGSTPVLWRRRCDLRRSVLQGYNYRRNHVCGSVPCDSCARGGGSDGLAPAAGRSGRDFGSDRHREKIESEQRERRTLTNTYKYTYLPKHLYSLPRRIGRTTMSNMSRYAGRAPHNETAFCFWRTNTV